MKQQIYIQGMTCDNCRKGVTEKMSSIPGITEVEVSLETGKAVFETKEEVTLSKIEGVLGEKYTATKDETTTVFQTEGDVNQAMLYFMGLFFITFSFFKFLDYQGFPPSFARYDPLAKKSLFYAKLYPFIETVLGVAFLLSWQIPVALGLTLVLLSITTYGVMQTILSKTAIQCACLGTALNLPMTEATLIENGIMIVMSCITILGFIL
jgi:copper chaperone CopZ